MYVCVCVLVTQSCLTLCNPTDCSPPGSSIHGILPGKNTGADCHFLLQLIFPTQGLNLGLPHCKQTLYCLSHHIYMVTLQGLGHSWFPSYIYGLQTVKNVPAMQETRVWSLVSRDSGRDQGSGRSSGEENGKPLQYSCLENPMDRGACRATVCGTAKRRTRLSD